MKNHRTSPKLRTFASLVEPQHTWDNLIIPKAEAARLHEIVDHVRRKDSKASPRGVNQGMLALFTGPEKTAQRIAMECIAGELRHPLYDVDLRAVASKYIGETEKNLRRLFDAAEEAGAILFFDEADALFGKRSEVKDSHDRYANIETNYLLQKMEDYHGLIILASNMKSALDPAFIRRLRFIVKFPFPKEPPR